MARKNLELVIEDEGRDRGKRFFITEMSAEAGERFAIRALLSAAAADTHAASAQLAFTDILAAFAKISFYDLEPLLNELMACVQICPDKTNPAIRRPLIEDDTEEILTRLRLKKAAFDLNFNFFMGALSQTFAAMSQKD